ncbi:unnamed protein product [Rotaria socialis]|uniref:Transmembrane protein n=1 Tax=Rotaria socialis TaxID=392032 RepID=A0A821WFH1_9BILA|nr:unnamed protein product [Rotaria socialis]
MSSYSDANYHRSMIFQNQIRMNYIQTLNPKPQNFLLNLNRRRIICLILILLIIHLKLLIEAWKMLNEISSKDEYLHQQWLFEQEKIVNQKKNLQEFLNNLKSSSNESAKPCKKCFDSISKFYSKAIVNIYEKNQNIKEEYNRIVLPLQYLSSLLCLINNFLIQIIFKKCWKFSFLSNILLILCLWVFPPASSHHLQKSFQIPFYWFHLVEIFALIIFCSAFSTIS